MIHYGYANVMTRPTAPMSVAKEPSRPFARLCAVKTAGATLARLEGSCRSLIGGSDPVKKLGTWADAHLRVVTPPWW